MSSLRRDCQEENDDEEQSPALSEENVDPRSGHKPRFTRSEWMERNARWDGQADHS